jgi:hypothetical protein
MDDINLFLQVSSLIKATYNPAHELDLIVSRRVDELLNFLQQHHLRFINGVNFINVLQSD